MCNVRDSLLIVAVNDIRVSFLVRKEMLLLSVLQTATGPNQPSFQRVVGNLRLGVEWPGYETNNLPTYSTKDKIVWSYISIPRYVLINRTTLTTSSCRDT